MRTKNPGNAVCLYYANPIPISEQSMIRLALRHQLQSGGSQLTSEESQIIENKRIRLQKLIDMFEHQADGFLLQHQPVHDHSISVFGDYAEYDHSDGLDDTGPSGASPPVSNSLGSEAPNAEHVPILLPSTLGWVWCNDHGVKGLAIKEAKLRYAQANDSIHGLCLALGFKSALFRNQVRGARTQQTKTRAWTAINNVDNTVHQHARNYSMARDAYHKIQDASRSFPELPPLLTTDLRVNTAILGAEQVGQRNQQLPWIWSFGISGKQDGTWMDECKHLYYYDGVDNKS